MKEISLSTQTNEKILGGYLISLTGAYVFLALIFCVRCFLHGCSVKGIFFGFLSAAIMGIVGFIVLRRMERPKQIVINTDTGYIWWKVKSVGYFEYRQYGKYLYQNNEIRIPFSDIKKIVDMKGWIQIVLQDSKCIGIGYFKEKNDREKIKEAYHTWKKNFKNIGEKTQKLRNMEIQV